MQPPSRPGLIAQEKTIVIYWLLPGGYMATWESFQVGINNPVTVIGSTDTEIGQCGEQLN